MKTRISLLPWIAMFALAALLCACFAFPAAARADAAWITSGVTATASNAVSPFLPSRAVDGGTETYSRWYASGQASLYLDLGKVYMISKIRMIGLSDIWGLPLVGNPTPYTYTVYAGSSSGAQTTILYTGSATGEITLATPATTRYLTISFGNGHLIVFEKQAWTGVTEVTAFGEALKTVDLAAFPLTPPVTDAAPQTTISTSEYTGTVVWSPAAGSAFDSNQIYQATVTLTCLPGYQLTGVPANFFTVTGASSVTNAADSGVVTAVFPATGPHRYAVTYDSNGGSGAMAGDTATQGTAMQLPECGFTAPAGKEFKEWAVGSAGGDRVSAGGTYLFTAPATVYALWEDFIPVTGITGVPTPATVGTPLTLSGTVSPSDVTIRPSFGA